MNAIIGIRLKNHFLTICLFHFFSLQFEICCYFCESENSTTKLMFSYNRYLLTGFYISLPKVKIDKIVLAASGLFNFRFLHSFAGKYLNILPHVFTS